MTASAAATREGERGGILRAFLFLTLHSARNRVRQQARRLRNPRYILAILLGVSYLYGVLFRQSRPGGGAAASLFGTGADVVLALGLVFLAARWWLVGGDQSALAFSPAEVQFLFPAPVSRRGLVHFKLLRSQLVVLVNTALWVALLRRGNLEVPLPLRALAFWTLFSTLSLHRLGASLVRASAREHGRAGARRAVGPMLVFGAVLVAVGAPVLRAVPAMRASFLTGGLFEVLRTALAAPPAAAVLLPFRALLRPSLAASVGEWERTIWPALLLMGLHYFWVVHTNSAFEEAAVEASARRAARSAALRDGRGIAAAHAVGRAASPTRLPLAARGEPAVALVWKNLVGVTRALRLANLLLLAGGIALIVAVVSYQSSGPAAGALTGTIAGVWAGLTIVTGPLWVRSDLRQDLPKLALLRSYPLPGRRVVAAEIASSVIVLSALQYALLAVSYVALLFTDDAPFDPRRRAFILAALVVGLPVLNAASLSIQNGIALLFPAWVRLGPSRPSGVEAMGQNLLTMLSATLLLALLLLLPALAGWLSLGALRASGAAWPAALVVALLTLGAEVFGIVSWLGRIFDRTEPTETGV